LSWLLLIIDREKKVSRLAIPTSNKRKVIHNKGPSTKDSKYIGRITPIQNEIIEERRVLLTGTSIGFQHAQNIMSGIIIDGLVKSPTTVMPDLIRHPEDTEITGFRPSPE